MSTENRTGSGTLVAMTTPARARPGRRYARLWRGVPRELGFLLASLPIVVLGLALLCALFSAGVGTVVVYVGFFLVLAALYVARGFGTVELVRLRWAARPAIPRPRWTPRGMRPGFLRATFGPFANGHYWLYLLHGMIINPIVGITTWTIALAWLATGLGGVTEWIWSPFIPGGSGFFLSRTVFGAVFPRAVLAQPGLADAVLQFLLGVAFLATLPFVTRGLTLLHHAMARGLLGAWLSEALQREVADLSASRGAAVAAEDLSLRRLERDIHDGPQQRLVRLQMDLAAAERRLAAGEADAAAHLLTQARGQAGDTLDELRALSRGFAPPILQDRGLLAALESLAARSTLPVAFDHDLDGAPGLPGEIERSAYFIAAELLTNAARHSGATAATLSIAWREASDPGVAQVRLSVTDDGHGGAVPTPQHGLSGLEERVRGLRGRFTIDSPAGGPTVVTASIPAPPDRPGPTRPGPVS